MKTITCTVGGKKLTGFAHAERGTLWLHLDGEIFVVESSQGLRTKRGGGVSSTASASGVIAAPMPGKIIKVLVDGDSQVEIGQVLIVMEAMKMEYTLKAPRAGKVKNIGCAVGDQVTLGQSLVQLDDL